MTETEIKQTNQAGSAWRFGEFDGSTLKYFVAALMVLDHIHQMFYSVGAPMWLTMVGRLVMPIFLFMCAEGFYHTRSRGKYMLRLLAGYEAMVLLSAVIQRTLPVEEVVLMNSAFGTMFVMCLLLYFCSVIHSGIKEQKTSKIVLGIGLIVGYLSLSVSMLLFLGSMGALGWLCMIIPTPLFVEGTTLIFMGMLFYAFRKRRLAQIAVLVAFSALYFVSGLTSGDIQWLMVFSAIPLLLYNGKRGRGGRLDKYFFYIFYPAHIYALYIIAHFVIAR